MTAIKGRDKSYLLEMKIYLVSQPSIASAAELPVHSSTFALIKYYKPDLKCYIRFIFTQNEAPNDKV